MPRTVEDVFALGLLLILLHKPDYLATGTRYRLYYPSFLFIRPIGAGSSSGNDTMDLLTAVLMFAPIIVLVSSNPFCPAILDEENVNPEHGWDKTNCNLHRYSSNDMVECLDLMVPSSPSKKKSFLFFGDSRIRQQFKAFVKVLFQRFKMFFCFSFGLFLRMPLLNRSHNPLPHSLPRCS